MDETWYEHAGGDEGLRRVISTWYDTVLVDPLLHPLFGDGRPTHVAHLTVFFGEVFGGPSRYTDELGGFPALLEAHRGLRISEEQRQRFVELFERAADVEGMPGDTRFRTALHDYLEFGTRVAQQNSHATTDEQLHECQEVPRWHW